MVLAFFLSQDYEDEGSCSQGQANRAGKTLRFTSNRLPAWSPGKSTDQRKPSGCATTRHLSLQSKPESIMPDGQPPGQKIPGVVETRPQASSPLDGFDRKQVIASQN
jgi:hypothetical protein